MESGVGQIARLIGEVYDMVQDISQKINRTSNHTILVGITGAGKSTLYCGLRGDQLKAKKQKLKMVIENQNPEDSSIGHSGISQTKSINSFQYYNQNLQKKASIIDTPGFQDTGVIEGQQLSGGGWEDLKASAAIKHTLLHAQSANILVVVQLDQYIGVRTKQQCPFQILQSMLGDLQNYTRVIGIVLTMAEDDQQFDDEVLAAIEGYYKEIANTHIYDFINELKKNGKVAFLKRPSKKMEGQSLSRDYFNVIDQLINRLAFQKFTNVKAPPQDEKATLVIRYLISNALDTLNKSAILENTSWLQNCIKNVAHGMQRKEIEDQQQQLMENFNTINLKCEQGIVGIIDSSIKILHIFGKYTDVSQEKKSLQMLKQLLCVTDIPENQTNDLQANLCKQFDKTIQEFIKITTLIIQKDPKKIYKLPEDCPEYRLLVARYESEKGVSEKCMDFMLTIGNKSYREYYFLLHTRDNGTIFIEERIYINEYNCGDLRNIETFDHKEKYEAYINLHQQIYSSLYQHQENSIKQQEQFKNLRKQLSCLIGEDKTIEILENGLKQTAICTTKSLTSFALRRLYEIATQQTFKFVTEEMKKQGIKAAFKMIGPKLLITGATVSVQQAGKEVAKGVITQVTKETVTIGAKSTLSVASFGVGLAINAAVGVVKAAINTKWSQDHVRYICEIHSPNFTFKQLNI